jgi:hypothetical protein
MTKATKIVLAFCFLLIAAFMIAAVQESVSVSTKAPVATRATALGDQVVVGYPLLCAPTTGACVAVTATSADYTLPTTGSRIFRITGGGGLASYAFIKCGVGTQTATSTAATGHNVPPVMDGQSLPPREITATHTMCAVIGAAATGGAAAAGGEVCFEQCNIPTGFAFGS